MFSLFFPRCGSFVFYIIFGKAPCRDSGHFVFVYITTFWRTVFAATILAHRPQLTSPVRTLALFNNFLYSFVHLRAIRVLAQNSLVCFRAQNLIYTR